MAGNHRHLSLLTLIVNGLTASIKIHRITNWIKIKYQLYVAYRRLISLKKYTQA
jgi:hypothetical protein